VQGSSKIISNCVNLYHRPFCLQLFCPAFDPLPIKGVVYVLRDAWQLDFHLACFFSLPCLVKFIENNLTCAVSQICRISQFGQGLFIRNQANVILIINYFGSVNHHFPEFSRTTKKIDFIFSLGADVPTI